MPSFLNIYQGFENFIMCVAGWYLLLLSVSAALIGDTFFNLVCSVYSTNIMMLDFFYGNRERPT